MFITIKHACDIEWTNRSGYHWTTLLEAWPDYEKGNSKNQTRSGIRVMIPRWGFKFSFYVCMYLSDPYPYPFHYIPVFNKNYDIE